MKPGRSKLSSQEESIQKMAESVHVLAIPLPLQGHLNPMVQLCNRLVSKGIRVTLIVTSQLSASINIPVSESTDSINIDTVPDCSVHVADTSDRYEIFFRTFRATITSGLHEIVEKYRGAGSPLKAIVYDSLIPWVVDLAHEEGLKGAELFTQPCYVSTLFYHMHHGTLQIPEDDGSSEVHLPAMPPLKNKDLPSLVYDLESFPVILRALVGQFSTFEKADWRLFNTFDKLEHEILKWLGAKSPLYTIGPTTPSLYTDERIQGNDEYRFSLLKPKDESYIQWLDSKQDNSVIYASFGTLAEVSEKQMEEVAWGLIMTGCNFLWAVRDTEQSKIPKDFITSDKGLIVNWCSQSRVLSHRAVACFLSHGGWNSTLEAICSGTPMVVLPLMADQTMNAKLIADIWRIGVRLKADIKKVAAREEVAALARYVVRADVGAELRRNATKWKELAVEAVEEGGSSKRNLAEFVQQIGST